MNTFVCVYRLSVHINIYNTDISVQCQSDIPTTVKSIIAGFRYNYKFSVHFFTRSEFKENFFAILEKAPLRRGK